MSKGHNVIWKVEKGGIAAELGIEPGDLLVQVNGQPVQDVFDFRYYTREEYLEILIQKPDGEEWLLEIEKDEQEDLGLVFDSGLMDQAKSCKNKCIFCFIDQLPKGMRDTLYFKDDDSRLSFLQGNYITLTNMEPIELDRILFYHLSPINVSVHTTDMALRYKMLKNPNATRLMAQMDKIAKAGIEMNFQVVLIKGVNDNGFLEKTIMDLSRYIPKGKSLSIVPVGITKYRERLFPLQPFLREDALAVIEMVEEYQKKFLKDYGTRFVYVSDEFYILAGQPLPEYGQYEDFPQIENGVGMISSFRFEFMEALKSAVYRGRGKTLSVITGEAAQAMMKELLGMVHNRFPLVQVHLYVVKNRFFGGQVTVSGLLTGQDIVQAVAEQPKGTEVLIPSQVLKADEPIFLDDMTIQKMAELLAVPVKAVPVNGSAFLAQILEE